MSHLSDDRYLDLLNGFLDIEEEAEALAHMAACPACEALLRERSAEHERLRARPHVVNVGLLSPAGSPGPAGLRQAFHGWPSIPRRWGVAAALAAVAVLAIIVGRPREHLFEAEKLRTWLPSASEQVVTRDAGGREMDQRVLDGIAAYDRRDVSLALRLLSSPSEGSFETYRRIYLASALVWESRFEEAAVALSAVPFRLLPEPLGGEARWCYFVSLAASGSWSRADSVLGELRREPGPLGERARGLPGR